MLLILVVLVLAAAGVIRLAQTLEPKQRVVLFKKRDDFLAAG